MAFLKHNKHPQGQFLIELLIAIGLVVIFIGSFSLFSADASRIAQRNNILLESKFMGRESLAALQMLWHADPAQLSTGIHGLQLGENNEWQLTDAPDTQHNFDRRVTIEPAERTASGVLTTQGIPDPSTKKITVRITHQQSAATLFEDTLWLPTIEEAPTPQWQSWFETTRNDFADGTFTRTQVVNTDGGEVVLRRNRVQGTYTSSRFNTGSATTSYSHVVWNGTVYGPNELRVQLRVARNNGLLSQASWFGPDGTSQTFFQSGDSIRIPAGVSGTRHVQYRVEFTQSTLVSPQFEDIEIFYAP